MNKKYLALGLAVTLGLTACNNGQTNPDNTPDTTEPTATSVMGAVSQGRAQEAVAGATVKMVGGASTTTDINGLFHIEAGNSVRELIISKDGFASTRVVGVSAATTPKLEEILRPAFDATATTEAPKVSVSMGFGTAPKKDEQSGDADEPQDPVMTPLQVGQRTNIDLASLPDDAEVVFNITTIVDSPTMNTVKTGIISFEVPGGTSGWLNNGLTRKSFVKNPRNSEHKVAFSKKELLALKGEMNLHVVAYDLNGNRVHLIQPINIVTTANEAMPTAPSGVKPLAITYADNYTFGAQGVESPADKAVRENVLQQVTTEFARQQATLLNPQAASKSATLWVDVAFNYPVTDTLPRAFELWRSLDQGKNFERVFSVNPANVGDSETGEYLMRDTSPLLTPGQPVTYRVAAVSDEGRAYSDMQTTTPLERYSVQLLSPGQFATNVSRRPVFSWTSKGASDETVSRVLVLDRIQAEGNFVAWLSDDIENRTAIPYNSDRSASQSTLQPYHAYEWRLASFTRNEAKNAVAIASDYFNVLGFFPSASIAVKSGPAYEFVTGGY